MTENDPYLEAIGQFYAMVRFAISTDPVFQPVRGKCIWHEAMKAVREAGFTDTQFTKLVARAFQNHYITKALN